MLIKNRRRPEGKRDVNEKKSDEVDSKRRWKTTINKKNFNFIKIKISKNKSKTKLMNK